MNRALIIVGPLLKFCVWASLVRFVIQKIIVFYVDSAFSWKNRLSAAHTVACCWLVSLIPNQESVSLHRSPQLALFFEAHRNSGPVSTCVLLMKLLNYLEKTQFIFICMGEGLCLPNLSVKRNLVLWGVSYFSQSSCQGSFFFWGGQGLRIVVGNISDL